MGIYANTSTPYFVGEVFSGILYLSMETGEFSYPQSWYPIHRSTTLRNSGIVPIEFFGRELVLFRTEQGVLGLVDRYCPHMGTDLSNGTVVRSCLVCPMHHWRFNTQGECESAQKKIRIAKFPVCEKYGIVFAFLGKEPLFDLPDFTGLTDPALLAPYEVTLENSPLAVTLNAFDSWHFDMVHHRDLTDFKETIPMNIHHFGYSLTMHVKLVRWNDYVMKYLGYNSSPFRLDCWGGNLIMPRNANTGHTAFLSMLPIDGGKRTKLYFLACEEKRKGFFGALIQRTRLPLVQFLAYTFIKSDIPVIKNMHPNEGALVPGKDELTMNFWKYWKGMPSIRLPLA